MCAQQLPPRLPPHRLHLHHDHLQPHDLRVRQVRTRTPPLPQTTETPPADARSPPNRDGGLPFSRFFARVHPSQKLPVNSLILTTVLVIIFGLIFLGSSAAFNAILSASVVALGVSYAIPPAINCLRGRRMLPATRPFKLSEPVGWACNLVGIAYAIVTTVLFLFPPALPVTGPSMNYCIVAFGIVLIISVLTWIFDGRKNYKGPRVELVGEGVVGGDDFDVGRDFDVDDQHRRGSRGGVRPHANGVGDMGKTGAVTEMDGEREVVEKGAVE